MENKYVYFITLFICFFGLPNLTFGQCDFDIDDTIITDATCGDANGAVDFTISGGVAPYTLDWSGGTVMGTTLTGLTSGVYDVTITDGTPCSEVVQVTIEGIDGPTIDDISTFDASCNQSNGSIAVSASGGTPPFTYDIGGPPQADNIFIGLSPGTYTVTVFDANGCTASATATVGQEISDLSIDQIITTNATCGNNDGTIEVFISGGQSVYNVIIGGNTATGNSPLTLTDLSPGVYDVDVTDSNGCEADATTTVEQEISDLSIDQIITTDATCSNNDGEVTFEVNSGIPPYSATIGATVMNGNSPFTFTGLSEGDYVADVTDSEGCTTSENFTIFDVDGPTIDNIIATDATCGQADGSVTVEVSGGTTPYTYDMNGQTQSSNTFTGLSAGGYSILITDANGCTNTGFVAISDTNSTSIDNITTVDATCGNADGSVTVTVSGGQPPYQYSINGGTLQSSNTFTDLFAGNHTVFIQDVSGCPVATSFTINEINGPIISNVNITNENCENSDGAIEVFVNGGTPPYDFTLAGITSTTGVFTDLQAGAYVITVIDANGCQNSEAVTIISNSNPTIFISNISNPCGADDGFLAVSAMNGVSPFNYNVNGTIFNNGNLTNLSAGVYNIIVTDGVGCTAEETVTLIDELDFSCFITGDTIMDCSAPVAVLTIVCPDAPSNFAPQWVNNPSASGAILTVTTPGIYATSIERCDGSMDFLEVEVILDPEIQCGTIQGKVTIDDNDNCTFDTDEVPFAGYLIQAVGDQTYFGFTDANGDYLIHTTAGDYEVFILNFDENLWLPCVASENVTVVANDIAIADFSIEKVIDCPLMEVQIATPLVRRCFNGYYTVSYCNNGTVEATDVSIVVTLPEFMTIVDAPSHTNNGDNTYKFEIEDLDFGDCGSFIIQIYTSCDAMLGQTLCASAEIFPQDPCEPINQSWSGASLEITATCDGSEVQYLITNVGTGDMLTTTEYIVIEDGVMFPPSSNELQLDAGQSMPINLPANGATYLLQVNQVAGHPGNSNPTLAVEACGINFAGIFTTGFINQFPFDDEDDFIDIDCHEVIGSYDPNDKQAFPMGYGGEHYITDSTEIDYLIRFQNTGTDTAFNIVVEDVLSEHLDITTLRPGVSSHPYQVDIFGSDTIHFVFENILLPDSNINEPLSHGFVQFSIKPRAGLPLETLVENYADIFFDFNEAIRTNTVFHTVGEDFIIISKDHEVFIPNLEIQVVPNPFSDQTRLTLKGVETQNAVLHLYNLQGQKMATQAFDNSSVLIKRNDLLSGMYFYKIELNGQLGGTGKLIIQ